MRQTGATAITLADIRWGRNDIKCTSLAANCMAAQAAYEKGAVEAILIDSQGRLTEGSHTSVFGVIGGKLIVSPGSANVLPGITKAQILQLSASAGIEVKQTSLHADQLAEIDELFITATPEEIIGIVELDGKKVGDGRPGPITRRLQDAFQEAVSDWLSFAAR
jgi:D-alanine transaminase